MWNCQEAGISTISTEEATGRVAVSVSLGTLAGFKKGGVKELGILYCGMAILDFWNPGKAWEAARMIRRAKVSG